MKLLLTSAGITNDSIRDALVDLLGKPITECRALLVPTAVHAMPGGPGYATMLLHELAAMGWDELGVLELTALPTLLEEHWRPQLDAADVIVVAGGNTGYLSYWWQQSGLAAALPEILRNTVYVGISAGGTTVTHSLNVDHERLARTGIYYDDEYDEAAPPDAGSDRALGLVDFVIRPHLDADYFPTATMERMKAAAAKVDVPLYAIDDQTAIKVIDGEVEVVSEGNWAVFNTEPAGPATGRESIVRVNGVDLCVATFGDPGAPPVLLIAGAACSMLHWDEEFCERLAAGPRFVIRYDHRDTGRSVTGEPGAPLYTVRDLLDDAIGILDALDVARAHLVGLSMGGGLAQLAAFGQPQRVASLTLIATSPGGPGAGPELPQMPAEVVAEFAAIPEPDWTDRAAVVEYLVEQERLGAARSLPFDAARMRRTMARAVDRSTDVRCLFNHFMLLDDQGVRGRLAEITAPTLVLHGEEDPVFPPAHGAALAVEIPGARLVPLVRTGHELPRRVWDVAVTEILRHTT